MGEWCPYCGKDGVEWRTPGDPRPFPASGPVCWECHTAWPHDTLYKSRSKAQEVGMCLREYEKAKSTRKLPVEDAPMDLSKVRTGDLLDELIARLPEHEGHLSHVRDQLTENEWFETGGEGG